MAVQCKLPDGTQVRLEDLPLSIWSGLANIAGINQWEWWRIMGSPVGFPAAAVELLTICAAHVGQEAPPVGYLTGATALQVFETVEDDMPGSFVDGVPDPKAAAEPVTTSS